MSLSRRQTLAAAGGGAALLALGGGWYAVGREPRTARDPWALPRPAPADVRLDAFRHAILAPNPHNRQPWRIRLMGETDALLYCDLSRRLPQTDPFDRQTLIGFGTFIEAAAIAATGRGRRLLAQPFPEGEPGERLDGRPVALLRFEADGVAPDPLIAMLPFRRTTRTAFEPRAPLPEACAALNGRDERLRIRALRDPALMAKLSPLLRDAWRIEQRTPRTWMESVELTRIGAAEVDANPDGVSLTGPMIEALRLSGVLTREKLAEPDSTVFNEGLEQQDALYASLPGALVVSTAGNGRVDQLTAGRAFMRSSLVAITQGLTLHPASQALQEFPEMAGLYAQVHELLAPGGERIQMLARLGHAKPVPPAPRWPLERALVSASV